MPESMNNGCRCGALNFLFFFVCKEYNVKIVFHMIRGVENQ